MIRGFTIAVVAVTAVAGFSPTASAAPTRTDVVTEADVVRQVENTLPTGQRVLYTRSSTPPTAASFVEGPAAPPLGTGSLRLTTVDTSQKVFLFDHQFVGDRLSGVADIGYATHRTSGEGQQVAALNVVIDFNGPAVAGGFSTLVFEPVYNTAQGSVVSGKWQTWDADGSGQWWSTRDINDQPAGAIGANFRSWDQIKTANPDAVVLGGVGVNQGSGNANLITNVDALRFGEVVTDFERIKDADGDGVADTAPPTSKDQCKDGGFKTFSNPSFANQGQCASYVSNA